LAIVWNTALPRAWKLPAAPTVKAAAIRKKRISMTLVNFPR
jgi:hypothetical protein